MDNTIRYTGMTPTQYERKTLLHRLVFNTTDTIIKGISTHMSGLDVLELGAGTGRYTKHFCYRNRMVCLDSAPQLFQIPGVPILRGDATQLSSYVENKKFDRILSFYMTEYLSFPQMVKLFGEAREAMNPDGQFVCSVVYSHGMGWIYTTAARLIRGIKKYGYSEKDIRELSRQTGFRVLYRQPIKIAGLNFAVIYTFAR